jgi:hypothetical protein
VQWSDKASDEPLSDWTVVSFKAAACGHLGRVEAARECVRRLGEIRPSLTIGNLEAMVAPVVLPEVLAHWVAGLRKAGLPEE